MKVKNTILLVITIIVAVFSAKAQEQGSSELGSSYKIITGVRVNPLIIYDLQGSFTEKVLLHGEFGVLFNQKIYTSVGYTAAMNAVYNFNEYWFIGFNKKVPVSWVIAEEYNFTEKKFFIQSGANIKLSKTGNLFAFLFTPTNEFSLGLKVGVFIPLNVVIKKG